MAASVYYKYCGHGSSDIILLEQPRFRGAREDKALIDLVIEEKRKKKIWDLVAEAHKAGGAWDRTFRDGRGHKNVIPKEWIQKYG